MLTRKEIRSEFTNCLMGKLTCPLRSFFDHLPHALSRLEAATRPYQRPESLIVRFWLRKSV